MKKRKIISIIALSLVIAMGAVSLTGCGIRTKATDITIEDGDAIIVDEEDMVTEEHVDTDDITETEVVGGDVEETKNSIDFAGAENDSIVLYAEIAEYGEYCSQSDQTFEPVNNTFTAYENLPIYNVDGIEVGYIKNGSTITFTGYASNAWARFENPIEGTDYDYLYGFKEYADVPNTTQIIITASDLEQRVLGDLARLEDPARTTVDIPMDDMEVYELRMDSVYDSEMDYTFWYEKKLKSDTRIFYDYKTYCVECKEDTDGWIICKIYYKDLIEAEY